ncbi:energy-coupling factor ABC transporter permease [Halopelagius inordinatus]|uniref:energy-coupling factor ABC transporter permease n=1 Tax=Halopelagius inordinatus TaxID=553467 RepID=UPI000B87A514|nr:energy-coupling factor ABC transporter permease [Halopelagius inordinatus]
MHILTGMLSTAVATLFAVASTGAVGEALRRAKGTLSRDRVRLFALLSATIFAAQMLNWPIPGGTSAHFVGGALAGILLGPAAGVLAMTVVVGVQGVLFADGGLVVLGANVWNMAVVNVLVGYFAYRLLADRHETAAVFAAGTVGVTAAALFAGLQLGASAAFDYRLVETVSTMTATHAALGVVEGLLTVGAVRFFRAAGAPAAFDVESDDAEVSA